MKKEIKLPEVPVIGSSFLSISTPEIKSIGRGILIMVTGYVLAEVTKVVAGIHLNIHYNCDVVQTCQTYDLTPVLTIAWGAAVNFIRKFIPDTTAPKQ